jgi:elongation factor Ts
MADISAAKVNELRRLTGLGLMECKSLLKEADGDTDKAVTLAKERGLKHAEKRAGRAAKAGRVEVVLAPDGHSGAIVELNCETDFVARNDDFRAMAREIAELVLAHGTSDVDAVLAAPLGSTGRTVRESLMDLNARTGENVTLSRVACLKGAGRVDFYVHHDGMKGALVQLSGPADAALAKDVAMHVVASPVRPLAVRREEVPAELVAEQHRIFLTQIANTMGDKPEPVREKIASGKLDAWYKETVLLEQEFIKDPAKKIRDLVAAAGKDLSVAAFARFLVGEAAPSAAPAE